MTRTPEQREILNMARQIKQAEKKERARSKPAFKAPHRQPRQRDNGHLAFIRRLPCIVSWVEDGRLVSPVDACHVRYGDPARGKRPTGMAEKPDDKWTLPMTRANHERQHSMSERAFYEALNIDPIELSERLYSISGDERAALDMIISLTGREAA